MTYVVPQWIVGAFLALKSITNGASLAAEVIPDNVVDNSRPRLPQAVLFFRQQAIPCL
jgi:hypothetical protein